MKGITYLTPEKIVRLNEVALSSYYIKKADKPEVLSYSRIIEILDECKLDKGDLYDKAVILLKGIIQRHPFASGNRRTAFIATNLFLQKNNSILRVPVAPENAKVLQGIRERYYTDEELKEWIKNGEIRRFVR